MKGLLQNELLKLRAQGGFKAVMIIVLVLSMLLPLGTAAFTALLRSDAVLFETANYYEEIADNCTDPIEKLYFQVNAESYRFFESCDAMNDWRFRMYFYNYQDICEKLTAYTLLASNKYSFEAVDKYFYISGGFQYGDFEIPSDWGIYEGDVYEGDIYNGDNEEKYPTAEECAVYAEKLDQLKKEIETIVAKNDAREYFRRAKLECEAAIQSLTTELEAVRTQTPQNKIERQKQAYEIETIQMRLQKNEQLCKNYAALIASEDTPDGWHYHAQIELYDRICEMLIESVDMGKEYYLVSHGHIEETVLNNTDSFMDSLYESATAENAVSREFYSDALERLEYCIQKDVPPVGSVDDGVSELEFFTQTTATILSIFMVVAVSITIASEYSSGTIRLLLIRPCSRRKILLSKYASVLIYSAGIALIAFVWQYLLSMLLFGAKELTGLTVVRLFGNLLSIPVILEELLYLLICFLKAWALLSFAIMIAVSTRKSALSIILPIILKYAVSAISSIASIFEMMIPTICGYLAFTPIPYLSPANLIMNPLRSCCTMFGYSTGSISISLFGYTEILYNYSAIVGIFWMCCFIALFSLIAFRSFRKQEIKS